ncbi:NAD-dependent epimerase/dehydratase family protein [Microvirga rosea]|uniref:NAD-dependent epimerase/dehydratase family protein n=1 Tax=Microvirga rosea TaxID=2715425 RepID=UPI001D0B703E|nr:NAD(P)-dependent oxidoreductase [Microvirga rosea]MCB8823455.1 NAD(P)-dependent oxidoreductase [Microvirga rosea]
MSIIVLTGGTGFVGRQIHKALVAAGKSVRLVVRPAAKARLESQSSTAELVESEDLFAEQPEWWERICQGADAVIHAAWYVEPGRYLGATENIACVSGSLSLAQGALGAGVGKFIGLGTCMEYRLPSSNLSVDSELDPNTLYASSKLSTFYMLRELFRDTDVVFSWCRLFYLYGEGEHPNRLFPYVRRQIESGQIAKLSHGAQIRDFLDVADAGRMIAQVLETGQPGAINICSGIPITVRQFAEQIADAYGRRDLLEFGPHVGHSFDPAAVVGICNLVSSKGIGERP